jgi:hypothetical protein
MPLNLTVEEKQDTNPAIHFKAFDKKTQYFEWLKEFSLPDMRKDLFGELAIEYISALQCMPDKETKDTRKRMQEIIASRKK